MSRRRQRGLSLIELMIAMLLGLIAIAAVFNMYQGTTRSARFTEGLQSMQESGRFGVSVLQRGLRLAGYSPTLPVQALDIAAGDESAVVVRLRQRFDCNGASTAHADGLAINRYAHDAAARTITCTGNAPGATPMTIVEGVEGFRVLYGLDQDDDDVPERYVPYDAALAPNRIAALRFALLVGSGTPIRSRAFAETHVLLDRVIERDDRIARTVFTSTVELRNRR